MFKVVVNYCENYDAKDIMELYSILRLIHYRMHKEKDINKIEIFREYKAFIKEQEINSRKELENFLTFLDKEIFWKMVME